MPPRRESGGRDAAADRTPEPDAPPARAPGLRDRVYGAAAATVAAAGPIVRAVRPALADQLAARAAVPAELESWALRSRRPGRPLVWVHGASAGELLGAAPIVEVLRRRAGDGDLGVIVTYFSPSGRSVAPRLYPDWHGHPPLDAPGPCGRALEAVHPSALVFAKLDVWPGLTRAAARRGIPVALVNGTVRPGSSRLRTPIRWLLSPAYARLGRIGAVSAEDADRLRRLGARAGAVHITGDAAFELALHRSAPGRPSEARRRLDSILGAREDGRPRLVAGSTWPADEDVLIAAAGRLAGRGRRLDLVVAPHEPTPEHVRRLRRRVREVLGNEALRWTDPPAAAPGSGAGPPPAGAVGPGCGVRVLVVDVVGALAELYAGAELAYVGGGFGEAGLHSVVEPAAAGVPVLFGPRHERREARDLLERGAARIVTGTEATARAGGERGTGGAGRSGAGAGAPAEGSAAAVAAALVDALLEAGEERRLMGRAARAYVESGAGAAEAGAELVLALLRGG